MQFLNQIASEKLQKNISYFYNQQKRYLFSKIINEKDIILLAHGGHGFKVLKDIEMIEVKQGPYSVIKDKVKFDKTDEKHIKIKKN